MTESSDLTAANCWHAHDSALWAYVERHGRLPLAEQADDLTELRALRREQTAQMQVDETALPDELLQ